MNKIIYFEYIIHKLLIWYKEEAGLTKNDLNKNKLMLLLFFVSSVKSKDALLLDKVFNNFHAYPYGPYEYDIMGISQSKYNFYRIGQYETILVNKFPISKIRMQTSIINEINYCIDILKSKNRKLILLSVYDLSEIVQTYYYCWKAPYYTMKKNGWPGKISTVQIPIQSIKDCPKIYHLSLNIF